MFKISDKISQFNDEFKDTWTYSDPYPVNLQNILKIFSKYSAKFPSKRCYFRLIKIVWMDAPSFSSKYFVCSVETFTKITFSKVKFEVPRVSCSPTALVVRHGRIGCFGQPQTRGRPASTGEICGGHSRQESFFPFDNFGVRKIFLFHFEIQLDDVR